MHFRAIPLFSFVLAALWAPVAFAQHVPRAPLASPPVMDQAQPPPPPPTREGTAEFAFVGTTGNASTQTIGLSGSLVLRPTAWVVINNASYLRNEAEGAITASAVQYLFRVERTYTPRLSSFGEYSYFRDRFAGVLHRHTAVGGVSYKLIDTLRHLLAADAGFGYLDELRLVPPNLATGVYAAGTGYRANISNTATFTDDLRFTGTFAEAGDWRVTHVASLGAQLTTRLSLKVSHTVRYAHEPVEGFEKTDTSTSVALVARF